MNGPDRAAEVYPAIVRDHFFRPRGAGRLPPGPGVLEVRAGERRLGAELELSVAISSGRVERAAFRAFGCPYLIAAASDLVEWLPGRDLAQMRAWSWRSQSERLDAPAERFGRLLVVEDAVRALCERLAPTPADP